MSINVNSNVDDPFYRYKMPKLLAKVEGKGNGIKTVVVNMVEVAKALNRPPMYPTKYFGCVLGAQTNYDKNDRYIVNGSHDSGKLQSILDNFIQRYVLCPGCSNPETVLKVFSKRGVITMSCKACGYHGQVMNNDKLMPYILKNPPIGEAAGTVPENLNSNKKEKKSKKKSKDESSNEADNNNDEAHANGDEGEDDDDWCEDTDADAVAKRMNMLSMGVNRLMANDDLEKSSEERLQLFFEYFKELHKSCGGLFDVNIQREIVAKAESLDIRDKAVLVLSELMFNEQMVQQIKQNRVFLLRFTSENTKAQKYLMRGFELVVKEYATTLLPKVALILKTLYDLDIVDEKVLLDWGSKMNKKTVGKELAEKIHEKAAPVLKWLREAEEEDSDESDEEDEINVVYDDRVRADKIQVQEEETPAKATLAKAAVNEDDLDIDAI